MSLGGAFEVADVLCAIEWLRKEAKVKDVVLWGRSAGAVACLGVAAELETAGEGVRGVLADSAFSDLGLVCDDLFAAKAPALPRAVRGAVASVAFAEVRRQAGWDPREHVPTTLCSKLETTPCLFAAARHDDLVPPKHAAALRDAVACPHKLAFEFDGGHNSPRPADRSGDRIYSSQMVPEDGYRRRRNQPKRSSSLADPLFFQRTGARVSDAASSRRELGRRPQAARVRRPRDFLYLPAPEARPLALRAPARRARRRAARLRGAVEPAAWRGGSQGLRGAVDPAAAWRGQGFDGLASAPS